MSLFLRRRRRRKRLVVLWFDWEYRSLSLNWQLPGYFCADRRIRWPDQSFTPELVWYRFKTPFILLRLHKKLTELTNAFSTARMLAFVVLRDERDRRTRWKPPTLDRRPLPCHISTPRIERGLQRWQARILPIRHLGSVPFINPCYLFIFYFIYIYYFIRVKHI